MSAETERDQLVYQLAVIREAGWTPDEVKAGTVRQDEFVGSTQFDRAQPGDVTYADLARRAGIDV